MDSPESSILDQHFNSKLVNFTSINDGTTQLPVTVSPKDLMMDSAPAPPSTSFTEMSTPSFGSSGYFSHDTSPLFADAELGPGQEDWESLFPADGNSPAPRLDLAPATPAAPLLAPSASPMIANDSSAGESPRSGRNAVRHSSVCGVNAKPRNRDKPLPPITYDTSDPVAVKRARNTEAARKSRARKVELQELQERRIAELEQSLAESRQREAYWKSIAEAKR
jgi:hypothetical protein